MPLTKAKLVYRELDFEKILNNYLKITGVLNNVFRPQKALKKTRIKLYKHSNTSPPSVVIWQRNLDY
jgi:hypothetical protein